MKFTSFNPLIVTKDAAPAIELFEALGFERRHNNTNVDGKNISNVTMKDANGFHVDVAQADVPRDMTIIRMNVDNFDEAYEYLRQDMENQHHRQSPHHGYLAKRVHGSMMLRLYMYKN